MMLRKSGERISAKLVKLYRQGRTDCKKTKTITHKLSIIRMESREGGTGGGKLGGRGGGKGGDRE